MTFIARLIALFVLLRGLKNRRSAGARPSDGDRLRESRLTEGSAARGAPADADGDSAVGSGSDRGIPPQRGGPGAPDTPLELAPQDWKQTLKRTGKEIKDDRVTLVAAGMAYYFFLAIFPAVIAAIGLLGLVHIEKEGLETFLRDNIPGGAGNMLVDAVNNADNPSEGASTAAAAIGIALALWSASSGFAALQSGLNVAYDVKTDRKFMGKRAIGVVLLLATGLLGGVPSPFFTFGDTWFFSALGWGLTLTAVIVLFALYYFLGPKRETPRWQWVSPGGVVGAVIWVLVTVGFGYYATNWSSYGTTYGSLAGVIILIFWLYLTSISILVGGELNAELERQGSLKQDGKSA